MSKTDQFDGCDYCGYIGSCRCMWCSRCGQLTGNTSQGHYWALCKTTGNVEEFHFCCPEACELEGIEPTKPFDPRYLAMLEEREKSWKNYGYLTSK